MTTHDHGHGPHTHPPGGPVAAGPPAPAPGYYRHFKGGRYLVVGIVRHSETTEPLVLYENDNGERWVRPVGMWFDQVQPGVSRFTFIPSEEAPPGVIIREMGVLVRFQVPDADPPHIAGAKLEQAGGGIGQAIGQALATQAAALRGSVEVEGKIIARARLGATGPRIVIAGDVPPAPMPRRSG